MKNMIQALVVLLTLSSSANAVDFKVKNVAVKDLVASEMNGSLLGPALPGTFGIEIKTQIPIPVSGISVKGKFCTVEAADEELAKNYASIYNSGDRYGLYSSEIDFGLTLMFINHYHIMKYIFIKCDGSDLGLSHLTLGEIETDLGNTVEFYKN